MPGFDGTGPRGLGSMTGGARGYCVSSAGSTQRLVGGRFFGRGRGLGRGSGRGRGFGRGFRWSGYPFAYDNPCMAPLYPANFTSKQEADMLKAEAKAMQDEISAINQRIKDLESNPGDLEGSK